MEVCLECHDDPVEAFKFKASSTIHSPILDDNDCTSCHSPHAGQKKMLVLSEPDLCYECHDNMTVKSRGEEYDFIHEPVGSGECTVCHGPHAGRESFMLDRKGRQLCLECHDDPALDSAGSLWSSAHPPVLENCTSCHVPHASDHEGQLVKDAFDLCTSCHSSHPAHTLDATRALAGLSGATNLPRYFPVTREEKMVCTGCHLPHGSRNSPLLREEKAQLCANCHG